MAVTVLRMDGWMSQTAALDPALLMYIRYVCMHAYVLSECIPIDRCTCVTPSALTVLSAKSDEETVTDLTGKTQAVLSPFTVKRSWRRTSSHTRKAALPLICPLCERETSQTVFISKTTGGLVCPPCKVHGELVRLDGPSRAVKV